MSDVGYQLVRLGMLGLLALFNALMAFIVTLVVAAIYEWLFPDPLARWYVRSGLTDTLQYFGWIKGLSVFVISFLLISLLYHLRSKNFDRALSQELQRNTADLKLVFGTDSTIEEDGVGYVASVLNRGKRFEANCYTYSSHTKGISSNTTATSAVTFPVADDTFEMSMNQKRGWASPKQEPPQVTMDDKNVLEVLKARYDCGCSDPRVMTEFIFDPAVRAELLPKHVHPGERLKIMISRGRATVECSANLNAEEAAARSATYVLMKKLIVRAQVIDAALARIVSSAKQQNE